MALILAVDDEESYLEVLSDVLVMGGHECVKAHDGRRALDLARERRPELVVTDHMMPRMTGVELIRALRDDPGLAAVPTVLVSAIRPAGAELATRFLQKPVHVDTIQREVSALVEPIGSASTAGVAIATQAQTREEALNWVAHEIKNPLGVAMMNAELLLRRAHDEVERKHLLTLKRQLTRMDELVMSVLDAARLDDGRVVLHRERADLRAVIGDIVDDWRAAHPEHRFELAMPGEAVWCELDRERARQVIDNLVSNAIKYGGADRRVEVRVAVAAGAAQVEIRDRGAGIAPQDLQRIFDRFHRAKDGGRGHGLGLYIAAALCRLHGGTITVESKLGAGSTFVVSLPVAG